MILTVYSCEKDIDHGRQVNTNFSRNILNGYHVESIAFDSKGNTWVTTYNQGIIKYNPNEVHFYSAKDLGATTDEYEYYDIAVDSKDNVWIGSKEGLIKYDGVSFTKFTSGNSPIPRDFVWNIAIDSKDNIWFGYYDYLAKYDGTSFVLYTLTDYIPEALIQDIAIDKNDDVWLSSSYYINSCYLIKIVDGSLTVYSNNEISFTPYFLGGIAIDSQNQPYFVISYIWGEPHSALRPQLFTFNGSKFKQIQFDNKSVPMFVMIDDEDNIWCNGFSGFYAVFNGQNWKVDYTTFKEIGVSTITQSPDKHIWVGTYNGIYIND